jgi:hypothetical protein
MPIRGPFCAPIDKVKSLNRCAGLPILLGRFGGFALDLLDQPAVVGHPEQVIHRVALARRRHSPNCGPSADGLMGWMAPSPHLCAKVGLSREMLIKQRAMLINDLRGQMADKPAHTDTVARGFAGDRGDLAWARATVRDRRQADCLQWTALLRLARPGAAAGRHRRKGQARSDQQARQRLSAPAAGQRCRDRETLRGTGQAALRRWRKKPSPSNPLANSGSELGSGIGAGISSARTIVTLFGEKPAGTVVAGGP